MVEHNGMYGKSLTNRLHENLRNLIESTEPGDRLPSEPKLAKQMGVSRATLREAMRIFENQGIIHRRQGVGTFVVPPSQVIETGLEVLESILHQADRKQLKKKRLLLTWTLVWKTTIIILEKQLLLGYNNL